MESSGRYKKYAGCGKYQKKVFGLLIIEENNNLLRLKKVAEESIWVAEDKISTQVAESSRRKVFGCGY